MTFVNASIVLVCCLVANLACESSSFGARLANQDENGAIGEKEKNGVTVRINQVQMQRIGGDVKISGAALRAVVDQKDFTRTIAISLSNKGQGKSQGPIVVTMSNGEELQMRITTNQRLISYVANASIPDGFDYAEYWFEVPTDTPFTDVFPLTIEYETTNLDDHQCEFKFERIFP